MRYLISISYDGSKFYGFQRLKNKESVQKKIEEALSIINKKHVEIKGAGRTDKGVHAFDQKASFDLDIKIDCKHLQRALNSLVKPYVYITKVDIVPSTFHARHDVLKKEYVYKINIGDYNPFFVNYYFTPNYQLDIKKMQKCAKLFLGVHNFQNFVAGSRPNYECIIYNIKFYQKKNILEIKFIGKSFYRYMVRNLVGTMLDVSKENSSLTDVKKALDNPKIKQQFTTAPPEGLYLNKIIYRKAN